MDLQAHLPPVLTALHNFIRKHDPDDIANFKDVEDPQPGAFAEGLPRAAERWQSNERWDKTMQEM